MNQIESQASNTQGDDSSAVTRVLSQSKEERCWQQALLRGVRALERHHISPSDEEAVNEAIFRIWSGFCAQLLLLDRDDGPSMVRYWNSLTTEERIVAMTENYPDYEFYVFRDTVLKHLSASS